MLDYKSNQTSLYYYISFSTGFYWLFVFLVFQFFLHTEAITIFLKHKHNQWLLSS